jgi:hypothetical protein
LDTNSDRAAVVRRITVLQFNVIASLPEDHFKGNSRAIEEMRHIVKTDDELLRAGQANRLIANITLGIIEVIPETRN